MCNSISLTQKQKKLEEHYAVEMQVPLSYEPYYHLAAYDFPCVYIIPQEDPKNIYPASWGFIPEFIKANAYYWRKRWKTWNARSEGVFKEDSAFRDAIRQKRCLIIADGFFEPHYYLGSKRAIPRYCYIRDKDGKRKPFAFAGVYSEMDDELFSCSILTKRANPYFAEIHNRAERMPIVLDESLQWEWLNSFNNDRPIKELMEHGFTKEDFSDHPVSNDIYKKGIDANKPYILEPIEPPISLF